ncbi:MAG: site-specific integrase [Desulfosalsimonadaceae bacterium]
MKWFKAKYPGIRFREHETRRHGVSKDKYFVIRYQLDGKTKTESLGWASEGWTEQKANETLSEIKKRIRTGENVRTLEEKRQVKQKERAAAITFQSFFDTVYLPAQTSKKKATVYAETNYAKNWIMPVIGEKSFVDISPLDIERLKKNMMQAGKAARTVEYIFAIIRQIWNMARRDGLTKESSPTQGVKKPKINNARERYLTPEESDQLLDAIKAKSQALYRLCLVSLNCGLRASEIFNLKWQHINLDDGTLFVSDGKGYQSRYAFMTDVIKDLFENIVPGAPNEYVFKDRNGNHIVRVSGLFQRTVDALGLNNGLSDRRQMVVFHSLRHTFASNLAQNGIDLYVIQRLMGHKTFDMVQRYSHLSDSTLLAAVESLNHKPTTGADVIPLTSTKQS